MLTMLPTDGRKFKRLLRLAGDGWIRFGSSQMCCHFDPERVRKSKKLPPECKRCFKALIFDFWDGGENVRRLVRMLNYYIRSGVHGKFDEGVVVFYIEGRDYQDGQKKIVEFVRELEEQMKRFGVEGRAQWRVSCKEYQNVVLELFKSAKELSEKALGM